ncbi:MAG: hypothetical protein OQK00_01260, partial [Rhodobacteraceae bacterium]|nr:hypothetical protein [Paracoccaceae bacterium]
MASRTVAHDDFDLVVFGGTGDLARRKILPALFKRYCAGQMPGQSRLIGASRSDLSRDDYLEVVRRALKKAGVVRGGPTLEGFLERVDYVALDATGETGWQALADNSAVVLDPDDPANQVLQVVTESTNLFHEAQLLDGEVRMLFLRFRYADQLNFSLGMSEA